MDKKKAIILAVVLLLLVGLGTFVFANPTENNLQGNGNSNITNSGENSSDTNVSDDELVNGEVEKTPVTPGGNSQTNQNNNLSNSNSSQVVDNSYSEALTAVEKAESTLAQADIDAAKELVQALNDGSNKSELSNRVTTVQNTVDVIALVKELKNKVNSATSIEEMNSSRDYRTEKDVVAQVADLASSSTKTELESTLTELAKLLDDNIAPVISGIEDGTLTKEDVTVSITDANSTKILLNGREVTASTVANISEEGNYTLEVIDDAFNTTGEISFTVDKTAPVYTKLAILNKSNLANNNVTVAKTGDTIRIFVYFDERLNVNPTVAINGNTIGVANYSENFTNNGYAYVIDHKITESDNYSEGALEVSVSGYADAAGNVGVSLNNSDINHGTYSGIVYDRTAPEYKYLRVLKIRPTTGTYVKNGETIRVLVYFEEDLAVNPTLKINGTTVSFSDGTYRSDLNAYQHIADYTIPADEDSLTEGVLSFEVSGYADLAGNVGTTLTQNDTNWNSNRQVIYDRTPVTIDGIDSSVYVYDGIGVTPTSEDEDINSVVLTKDGNEVVNYQLETAIVDAGNYVLTVTDVAGNETVKTFEIQKAETVIEITLLENLVYDATEKSASALLKRNDTVLSSLNVVYDDANGNRLASAPVNAGTYTAIAHYAGDANHKAAYKRVSFEITKATPIIEMTLPSDLVYDDNAKEVTAVLKRNDTVVSNLTVVYDDANGNRLASAPVNAGTYTAIAYFAGDANHKAAYNRVSFEITKAATTIEMTVPTDLVYSVTSKEVTAVLKINDTVVSNLTVVYDDANGNRLASAPVNAGTYTAIAYFGGDANHKAAYNRVSFEITKATPTIELTEPTSFVYDATKKEYGIKVIGADGNEIVNPDAIVVYKNRTTGATLTETPTDAGSYTLGIYVRPNENYTRADKWLNFEIAKADTTIEMTVPTDLVYSATSKEVTAVLKRNDTVISNLNVVYNDANGNRLASVPVNAGTYTAIAHYAGDANHKAAYKRVSFEITKATPTIQLTEPDLSYDGTRKEYGISVIGADGNEIVNPDVITVYKNRTTGATLTEAPSNSGSYSLGIYVRPNENYTRADKWVNFEIVKKVTNATELQNEIQNARNGDIIYVTNGIYIMMHLTIDKDITLRGESHNTIIDFDRDPYNGQAGLYIKGNVTLENLKVRMYNDTLAAIKASAEELDGNQLKMLDNFKISNVKISGGKSGLNIHGVRNAIVDKVEISNAAKLPLSVASSNVTVTNTTLSTGAWGSAGIMYKPFDPATMTINSYPTIANVTIGRGNVINGSIYAEYATEGNAFTFSESGWTATRYGTTDVYSKN